MLIVFTDLDATLLDHESYDWRPATPALDRLRKRSAPVVLCSSKTAAEIAPLWREIGTDAPFIVENGGGVFLPPGYQVPDEGAAPSDPRDGFQVITLGAPYAELRRCLEDAGHPLGARGFGDMTAEQVADATGLSPDEARRARRREFTEPFLLDDLSRLAELEAAAGQSGLKITRGGRFFHLQGRHQDKGRAVERVTDLISRRRGDAARTIGLGDSPNDRGMLEAVDVAVIVPHPERGPLELDRQEGVVHAPAPGPAGWNAAVLSLLDQAG